MLDELMQHLLILNTSYYSRKKKYRRRCNKMETAREKKGRAEVGGSNCSTFMEFFFSFSNQLHNSNGYSGEEANGERRRNTA